MNADSTHNHARDAVTGAFGYTGKYITRHLLARGRRVRTLTNHPGPAHAFGTPIEVAPLDFRRPDALAAALAGVDTLYNTYWVRFCHRATTFDAAIENTRSLLRAAERAGVRRIVHVSITNPSLESPFPYFRGKAVLEGFIAEAGLSHAFIRPTVVFGREDILINNIAWLLRRLPVFGVPGRGEYRLRPIFVEDLARLAVEVGAADEDLCVDAVGPETFTFEGLVCAIRDAVRSRARIVRVPPRLALTIARAVGLVVGDVTLTQDEMGALMQGLLDTRSPATGTTALTAWLRENGENLGRHYASELRRHFVTSRRSAHEPARPATS